jgi:hypothetical protein
MTASASRLPRNRAVTPEAVGRALRASFGEAFQMQDIIEDDRQRLAMRAAAVCLWNALLDDLPASVRPYAEAEP